MGASSGNRYRFFFTAGDCLGASSGNRYRFFLPLRTAWVPFRAIELCSFYREPPYRHLLGQNQPFIFTDSPLPLSFTGRINPSFLPPAPGQAASRAKSPFHFLPPAPYQAAPRAKLALHFYRQHPSSQLLGQNQPFILPPASFKQLLGQNQPFIFTLPPFLAAPRAESTLYFYRQPPSSQLHGQNQPFIFTDSPLPLSFSGKINPSFLPPPPFLSASQAESTLYFYR